MLCSGRFGKLSFKWGIFFIAFFRDQNVVKPPPNVSKVPCTLQLPTQFVTFNATWTSYGVSNYRQLKDVFITLFKLTRTTTTTLQWRHNGHNSLSNHQPHDCKLNRLFRRWSKKISKLRVTGLCAGNSPGTGEFPAQMASNAGNVSIWWRHHGFASLAQWDEKAPVTSDQWILAPTNRTDKENRHHWLM